MIMISQSNEAYIQAFIWHCLCRLHVVLVSPIKVAYSHAWFSDLLYQDFYESMINKNIRDEEKGFFSF